MSRIRPRWFMYERSGLELVSDPAFRLKASAVLLGGSWNGFGEMYPEHTRAIPAVLYAVWLLYGLRLERTAYGIGTPPPGCLPNWCYEDNDTISDLRQNRTRK